MKFTCRCGALITDTTDFLPNKAYLIADQDLEDFFDAPEPIFAKMGRFDRLIHQCDDCGRLWVDDASRRHMTSFRPEDGTDRVLASRFGAAWKAVLIGQWRSDRESGTLFCGSAVKDQGLWREFGRWEELERAYREEFEARHAAGTLRAARLGKDGAWVHEWPPAAPLIAGYRPAVR